MQWTIISLGGAIIVPDDIDVVFLKRFRRLLMGRRSHRFVIVCGGGGTNRHYNAAANALTRPSADDLDWLGIRALTLNAELVRVMFGRLAYGQVVLNPAGLKRVPSQRIIIGAAFRPGSSSDLDAVLWAEKFKARRVINLSNISHVYSADPRSKASARPLNDLTWADYRRLIGRRWSPRLSTPFDPVASARAVRLGLTVAVLNGRNIANVQRAIDGKLFVGTVLHP